MQATNVRNFRISTVDILGIYGNCSKIFCLFSNKMLIIRARIHKMLVCLANRSSLIWVCTIFFGRQLIGLFFEPRNLFRENLYL